MAEPDQTKFVTYRSLLVSLGTTAVIILGMFGLYIAHMEKKVNVDVYLAEKAASGREYSRLCDDINQIKSQVDSNAKLLDEVRQNQMLVLRALKIQPVK